VSISGVTDKLSVKTGSHLAYISVLAVFLRRFRDPIQVPRIKENYHRVPKIRGNRVLESEQSGPYRSKPGS